MIAVSKIDKLSVDWQTLVKRRVLDATRRSRTRGCPERLLPLQEYAARMLHSQNYTCILCGKPMETRGKHVASLDRVFSSVKPSPTRGESCKYFQNSRWVCWSCNHKTRHCHMRKALYRDSACI